MVSIVFMCANTAFAAKPKPSASANKAKPAKTSEKAKTAKTTAKGKAAKKEKEPAAEEPSASTGKTKERNRKEIKYTGFDVKRDPFAAPEKIAKMIEKPADLDEAGTKIQLPKIELQGIIWAKNMPQAIINGAVMKVGDFIEEFEIKEISRNGIILFFKGRDYSISMQTQNLPKKKKKSK